MITDPNDERYFAAVAAELRRRVATVHERQACPRCGAGAGVRCVRVNARSARATLKNPHDERIRADGIALR